MKEQLKPAPAGQEETLQIVINHEIKFCKEMTEIYPQGSSVHEFYRQRLDYYTKPFED